MSHLVITDLHKSYPTPAEPLVVLDGATFELSPGESLAIVGVSGSGKSTLLSIVGTLDEPTSGTVRFAGQDPFALDPSALAQFRAEQIGFIFQEHHLLPQCTAVENVLVPLLADRSAGPEDRLHAESLLEQVGLADRLMHRPAELSGGERQRVAIARALVRNPLLLLADEPTGNLDRESGESVAELLHTLQQDRMLIVVTHSALLADRMDRRGSLESGRLIF